MSYSNDSVFILFRNTHSEEQIIGVFSSMTQAITHVWGLEDWSFRIYEYSMNTDDRIMVWDSNLAEDQRYEANIISSKPYIETTPQEIAMGLRRILKENPGMTVPELAREIGKPERWVEAHLALESPITGYVMSTAILILCILTLIGLIWYK